MKHYILSLIFLFSMTGVYAQSRDIYQPSDFSTGNKKPGTQTDNDLRADLGNYHREGSTGLNIAATILTVSGGALIGAPIGTSLGGGNPKWALAGIGAGLIVLAIPLYLINKKHAAPIHGTALKLNHRYIGSSGARIYLSSGPTCIGLTMRF